MSNPLTLIGEQLKAQDRKTLIGLGAVIAASLFAATGLVVMTLIALGWFWRGWRDQAELDRARELSLRLGSIVIQDETAAWRAAENKLANCADASTQAKFRSAAKNIAAKYRMRDSTVLLVLADGWDREMKARREEDRRVKRGQTPPHRLSPQNVVDTTDLAIAISVANEKQARSR